MIEIRPYVSHPTAHILAMCAPFIPCIPSEPHDTSLSMSSVSSPLCLLISPSFHAVISLLCPRCHTHTTPHHMPAMCPPMFPLPPRVFPVPLLSLFTHVPDTHTLTPPVPPHAPSHFCHMYSHAPFILISPHISSHP